MSRDDRAVGDAARLETELRRLERLADWLDSRFRIPGTRIRFGLDSLVGLVPGVGDGATAIPAVYIILRARGMGVSWPVTARMVWNVAIDLGLGSIPVAGDIFDLRFKSNRRNVALLRRHLGLQRMHRATGGHDPAPNDRCSP